jgi:hypothetical protein
LRAIAWPTFNHKWECAAKIMLRKNLFVIIIVLLALLLIAFVLWYYDARIKNMEKKAVPVSMIGTLKNWRILFPATQ